MIKIDKNLICNHLLYSLNERIYCLEEKIDRIYQIIDKCEILNEDEYELLFDDLGDIIISQFNFMKEQKQLIELILEGKQK